MVTISFLGDISLNDEYTRLFREGEKPFEALAGSLADADLVAGNLECLAAGSDGENMQKKPRLKTDVETLGYLGHIKLGLACLAHNHVYDNLKDGYQKTVSYLKQNGIHYLGAWPDEKSPGDPTTGESASDPGSILRLEIKGIRFAFFNYVAADTNPGLPEGAGIKLSLLDRQRVIQDLEESREADFRILLLHWGGRYENSYFPGPGQVRMAKEFIRAGADLIIGHHSHTYQPVMRYRGKTAAFSLGNFCFADINSDGMVKEIRYRRWRESAVFKANFDRDGYRTQVIPFRLHGFRTVPAGGLRKRYAIRQFIFGLMRITGIFWYIYYFGYRYLRPVAWELRRRDPDRTLIQRLFGLKPERIGRMFKP